MPPVIQIHAGNGDNVPFTFGFPFVVVVLFALIQFAFLYRILTRTDFDTLNKILWVIVVIGAPLIGVALYLLAAPSALPQGVSSRARSARHGDDLSGTPWADNPNYTKPS